MKKLLFIIRRITQVKLASRLNLKKANVTAWKVANRIPVKHLAKLNEIYNEVKNESKIKK